VNPIASSIVAVGILATIAGITIAAILRYSIDDALKIWGALSALVGVVTGSFVTYFFTRQVAQQANKRAEESAQAAQAASRQNALTSEALQQAEATRQRVQLKADDATHAAQTLARALEKSDLDELTARHPVVKSVINPDGL
jgi:hypothetical protein